MRKSFIDPLRDFGDALFHIQKPARYVGGECDAVPAIDQDDQRLRIAICFPDLYEIGMSNNAIRILYSMLNEKRSSLICERVFAPAPDFENLLREKNIPLYTLESGIPLSECDILAFSIGYELLATNVLTVMERGGVPIESIERSDKDPIVLAGGPAVTNPLPFDKFFDAVWIGEAEAGFVELMDQVAELKKSGAQRTDILRHISRHPSVWMSSASCKALGIEKKKRVVRAIYPDFPKTAYQPSFPYPVLNPVHSHGTVEIMRGCPNGCRFCHAGYYYRPQRSKYPGIIQKEVEDLVMQKGYREITLSSLSSGDYPGIVELFETLNSKWSAKKISFQLPSLKVDSFTLPLLEKISEVRKSGLTFAVETPLDEWQCSINKRVPLEKIELILREAKAKGFRSAKFYFMIGLPVSGRGMNEAEAIVEYIKKIAAVERIAIHVNVGTFIPKAHTPYEREEQLSEEEALECINYIRRNFRYMRNIDVTYHPPFLSVLEGIISRGDEAVGDLIIDAYRSGARLDAWEEFMNRDVWRAALKKFNETRGEGAWQAYLHKRSLREELPWHTISLKVSQQWLKHEKEKAENGIITAACNEICTNPCGICDKYIKIVSNSIHIEPIFDNIEFIGSSNKKIRKIDFEWAKAKEENRIRMKLVFTWSKRDLAVLYPMHEVANAFSRAFQILGIPMQYTEGFNPQPKLELSPPLPLGVESERDILGVFISVDKDAQQRLFREISESSLAVLQSINENLPKGLAVDSIRLAQGKHTIGSLFSAAEWKYAFIDQESYSIACAALCSNSADFISWKSFDDSRELFVLENFEPASGKIKNFYKTLKTFPESSKGKEIKFRACRTKCFAKDEAGNLLPLEEAL